MREQGGDEEGGRRHHARGEGKEDRRQSQICVVEEVHAVVVPAGLRQLHLEDVADRRVEQVHQRHLEAALRIDGEGRRRHAPAYCPLVERLLWNVEQDGGAERQCVGQLLLPGAPVEPRAAALEEESALQHPAHGRVQHIGPEESRQTPAKQQGKHAGSHPECIGEEDHPGRGLDPALRGELDLQRRGGDHEEGDQRHLRAVAGQLGVVELPRDGEARPVEHHRADPAEQRQRGHRLRQPFPLAAVLAGQEVVEALRQAELEHEVAGADHQPDLLVGAEFGLRQQAGEDQRQRETQHGGRTAAHHQGARLTQDSSRLRHRYPWAEAPCPAAGFSEVSKLVGRAPSTGFCSASIPKVSSNWQAISGLE